MSIISHGPLNKVRVIIYYSYIQVELGNLGGVILLALCAIIIVHPNKIFKKECSSKYLYSKNTIRSNTIIEITDIIHNILTFHIGIDFFPFSKFLPTKVT